MSVQPVGGLSSASEAYASAVFEDEVTSVGGRLAVMVLTSQQQQQQADHELMDLAVSQFKDALAAEVEALHDAADQAFWGALTQGAIALGSGALTAGGALSRETPTLGEAPDDVTKLKMQVALSSTDAEVFGGALGQLAEPAGSLVSGSNGEHSRAEARLRAGDGEEAKWELNEARDHLNGTKDLAQRTIDWLEKNAQQEAAATSTVLANMA